MPLSGERGRILMAMAAGTTLKAHRYLDGRKLYRLHALEGITEEVGEEDVQRLVDQGLIDSNKKFPAATFWLTEKGREIVTGPAQNKTPR
jgi:hypothetical protein